MVTIMKTKKKDAPKGELIYGINPLCELLKAKKRKLLRLYTTKPEPRAMATIKKLMPRYPVPMQYVTRAVLQRMVDSSDHQGIVAWVQSPQTTKRPLSPAKYPFILMLDGIQDPRNLGAILRSAYCTGINAAVLPQKNSAPLNTTALKASAGLAEHLEIYIADNSLVAAKQLKEQGYELALATLDGEKPETFSFNTPTCLVIGAEGTGISSALLKLGPHITIAQRAPDISYNASVAAGILLHFIARKKELI